jgi:hypothetical protein
MGIFEYQYVLYNKGKGCGFYERGKREAEMYPNILPDFDILWTTKERLVSLRKLYMCQEFMILQNVTGMLLSKQTPYEHII